MQTFKVGPDFLDPTYLALASGRTCYNLDGWMTSAEYVRQLFARATADADLAVIEGVMGLFDGASPASLEGSTAEIALLLDAPVVLVVNAHGAARSLAATVKGFAEFEPGVRIAGVIANQSGSPRHRDWLAEALGRRATAAAAGRRAPRGAADAAQPAPGTGRPPMPGVLDDPMPRSLADACGQHLDMNRTLGVGRAFRKTHAGRPRPSARLTTAVATDNVPRVRLGIARDEAFHFYYADNLEALQRGGAELAAFSPLADAALPEDLDGLYFGGGYPEVHAARLAANRRHARRRAPLRRLGPAGLCRVRRADVPWAARCGRSTAPGTRWPASLPVETAMLETLKTLGYAEVTSPADSLWGAAGRRLPRPRVPLFRNRRRPQAARRAGSRPTLALAAGRGRRGEGFAKGRVLASYVHLHWASRPRGGRALSCPLRGTIMNDPTRTRPAS